MTADCWDDIVVFSKSYCPYCKAAKSTLRSLDADFELLELDQIGMLSPLLR
jgi:glutaredoxin